MGGQGPRPALFLDRDGVLNRWCPGRYVTRWEEFHWLPGALGALRAARDGGWTCAVVTNQAGVSKGLCSQAELDSIHRQMRLEAEAAGGAIAGVYACPHLAEDGCACRKPRPGLLLAAARELGVDLRASWLVGDSANDIGAAQAAGASWLLVRTGGGAETEAAHPEWPRQLICEHILAAVERIGPCPPRSAGGTPA